MSPQPKSEAHYFEQGREAYRCQQPRSSNPYEWTSDDKESRAYHWDQGWEIEFQAAEGFE
jgi:hypothetical protein